MDWILRITTGGQTVNMDLLTSSLNNVVLNDLIHNYMVRNIIGAVIIVLIFMIINKILTRYVYRWLEKMASRTETEADDKFLGAILKPLQWLILTIGVYAALKYLPLPLTADQVVTKVFRTLLIIYVTWGVYALASGDSVLSEKFKIKLEMNETLIAFFSKIARFIIIAIGIVIVFQEWDYDISGFVAGLGLGGLAFALAAQDALANIFGGMVLIMEKPFSVGDWIATPSVEGFVEEISFRSTRIRAFAQSQITVPNSTLANEPITNYTRMGKRRITFRLGVTYDTPREKLQQTVEAIRQMLVDHPEVHPETVHVYFEQFNDSSLDIFLYYFTEKTDWGEYLKIRQDTNFKIMAILEELGVEVAFPSRSIYFETPQIVKNLPDGQESDPTG